MVCINDVIFAATGLLERVKSLGVLKMNRKSKPAVAVCRKNVLLVDRHVLMRSAAAGWINRCSGFEVCGVAGGMSQAFKAVKRLRPDMVVSEIMRPHDLGFIRELHRRHPRLPILVFSIQDEAVYGGRAREAGASAYLMKETGGDALVRSIRVLMRRRTLASHGLPAVEWRNPGLARRRAKNLHRAG